MSLALVPDLDWRADAACLHHNPDLWFPHYGTPGTEARRICAGCPVRTDCLDYALANNEDHGIWGGRSERERRRIRRGRPPRPVRPPTTSASTSRALPDFGATHRTIEHLRTHGPSTARQIITAIDFKGPKISGILGRLIDRGIVTRSTTPGQVNTYTLTESSTGAPAAAGDGIDRTPVPHPQEHT